MRVTRNDPLDDQIGLQWTDFVAWPKRDSSQRSWFSLIFRAPPATIRVLIRIHLESIVQKKLTVTLDERVYDGLYTVVGRRRISQFIESLVRPYVVGKDLELAYQQMARDEAREAEAQAWAEATCGDAADETR
jgi:hypothetical protein